MSYPLLERIDSPDDLKKLSPEELPDLANELREFILDVVAVKPGHLGAGLGVVELTIALHYVFDTPLDKLVWDVGHQAYPHKVLTGRRSAFDSLRQYGGLSGFPKRDESPYDTFGTGHSSTAISAALGMALAAKIQRNDRDHIAVVGDASIASGMAFEALNHAGTSEADLLVILNDNAIGIDPSVGALKEYLVRTKAGSETGQDNIFEALNFDYSGPMDGHDLPALLSELSRLRERRGIRFLHVRTVKGKGMPEAERDQVRYHAPGPFDRKTGRIPESSTEKSPPKFQDVFGLTLVELAEGNDQIVGITPAMPTGSSMKYMMQQFPDRAWDVGIAEQHAVTLAAGMAAEGLVPFCAIYSTFLQRAYDQLIHDVALQNLPVVFCIDRAGLVGEDGPTHHGSFDLAYLRCIPNMIIAAPMDAGSLRNLMFTAQTGLKNPLAIRYPRGKCGALEWKTPFEKLQFGKSRLLQRGTRVAVLTLGAVSFRVSEILNNKFFQNISHVDVLFLKPIDLNMLEWVFDQHQDIVTIEDGAITGGLADEVSTQLMKWRDRTNKSLPHLHALGIPDDFVPHGSVDKLHSLCGFSGAQIEELLKKLN